MIFSIGLMTEMLISEHLTLSCLVYQFFDLCLGFGVDEFDIGQAEKTAR